MDNSPAAPNIMIVDDTPANLRLLGKILSTRGYRVRPLLDGAAAVEAAQAAVPDLILLDIRMPGLDGYAVCEQLKAAEATRQTPVIFLSALTDMADKLRAFQAGGVDYITKPFQAEEVLARVQTHLALRQAQLQVEAANSELRQSLLREQRMNQLSAALSNIFDAGELIRVTAELGAAAVEAEHGQVWLLAADGQTVEAAASSGPLDAGRDLWRLPEPLSALRLARAEQPADWPAELADTPAASLLVAPMLSGERRVGAISFLSSSLFSAHDLALAESIGRLAALTLEKVRLFERTVQMAQTDGLTGLSNRTHFLALAEHEFINAARYQRALSLILLDIDLFKRVNDQHGHAAGDEALRAAARAMRAGLREADQIARYGGEEFIVLLPMSTLADAHPVAERLRTAVAQTLVNVETGPLNITISLGLTELRPEDRSIDDLARRADAALYAAKRAGRNRVEVN